MRNLEAILYGIGIVSILWFVNEQTFLESLIIMSAVGIGALIYLARS